MKMHRDEMTVLHAGAELQSGRTKGKNAVCDQAGKDQKKINVNKD